MSLLFTLRSNSVSLRASELHFVYSCVFKFPRDIIRIYLGQEYPVDNPYAVGGWLVGGKVFEFEFACLYGCGAEFVIGILAGMCILQYR